VFAERVRSVLAPRLGVEVVGASSLAEAESAVGRETVTCVVSRCQLPDADGTVLVERLRSVAPETPLVLCPSETHEALAVRAARTDGVAYLPVDASSRKQGLLSRVEWFLEAGSRRNRETVRSETVERAGRLVRNLTHETTALGANTAVDGRADRQVPGRDGRSGIEDQTGEDEPWRGRLPANEEARARRDGDGVGSDGPETREHASPARGDDPPDDSPENGDAAGLPTGAFEEACRGLAEVVDARHAVIYRYDGFDRLVPTAWTTQNGTLERPDEIDSTSPLWEIFETGEATIERSDHLGCELLLPVGTDGLARLTHPDSVAFHEGDLAVGRVYVPTLETLFDRADAADRPGAPDDQLEELAGVISHDLQNPLTVALGHIERLESRLESDESLGKLKESLEHMERVVDDTLHFASEGELVGETAIVSLERAAEWSWSLVEPKAATLEVEADLEFEADTDRLNQLLENLFKNAVTHAGPEVRVTVGVLDGGAGFYVDDDGPGVSPEQRDVVFELGHTSADDGTGFGLATVDRIANAHGWSVECTESPAGGARFLVRF
jgi:signal transduction histidine kinase/FixJ family two-component response regulator